MSISRLVSDKSLRRCTSLNYFDVFKVAQYYRVIEWDFSYWCCIMSKDSRIGPRIVVLSRGNAEAQYGCSMPNATVRGRKTETI